MKPYETAFGDGKTEHNIVMKTKPVDELTARAQQHFVDSIETKQLGAKALP
ncbi:MAG: hypothetical protein RLY18_397 [Pseudomonadota bacterium]